MIPRRRGTLTATITPAGTKNNMGDPVASASAWTIEGCDLAPGDTTETQSRSDTVATSYTLYAPPGSLIPAAATVEVGGITAYVNGDPDVWSSGVIARLRRVTG